MNCVAISKACMHCYVEFDVLLKYRLVEQKLGKLLWLLRDYYLELHSPPVSSTNLRFSPPLKITKISFWGCNP